MGRVVRDGLADAEVQHLDDAARRDLDVRRLQIPVDDALLVRGVERIGDLPGDVECVGDLEGAALRPIEPFGKRVAIDQLEDERVDVG